MRPAFWLQQRGEFGADGVYVRFRQSGVEGQSNRTGGDGFADGEVAGLVAELLDVGLLQVDGDEVVAAARIEAQRPDASGLAGSGCSSYQLCGGGRLAASFNSSAVEMRSADAFVLPRFLLSLSDR